MKTEIHSFDGINIKTVTLDVAIIGTGAAGYNAAVQLKKLGVDDIAIITEGSIWEPRAIPVRISRPTTK